MKTLADGVAILIGDDDIQHRGRWHVRLEATAVVLEFSYRGTTHAYEPDMATIITETYDCYALAAMARLISEAPSSADEPGEPLRTVA